jgi:hypothetical protein
MNGQRELNHRQPDPIARGSVHIGVGKYVPYFDVVEPIVGYVSTCI